MIALTGGTGFLGRHLVSALTGRGLDVTCLVRPQSPRRGRLDSLPCRVKEVSFHQADSIASALEGAETVIHLLGLINGSESDLRRVNVDYTRRFVEAAQKKFIKKIIFVSTVAAIRRHGLYGETKYEAEQAIAASGIPFVLVRPAFVYGEGDENNTGMLLKIVKSFPVIPLLGGGDFKLQPVYVDDVISLLLQILDSEISGRAYVAAGPRQVSLREILESLSRARGVRRFFVPVPLRPVQAAVRVYGSVFKGTKLPVKQILELDKHEAFDISETQRDFDFNPVDFKIGVERMFQTQSCAV